MKKSVVVKSRARCIAGALVSLALLLASTAHAADFAALQSTIQNQENFINQIELDLGRYDAQLIEPLAGLARMQLAANRFDDAAQTVDRAIQIARYDGGLFSSQQYRLLQLEIAIARSRGNWEDTAERLAHFTWLAVNRFDGDPQSQLDSLEWLANEHLECALASVDEQRASFLIEATSINEYAVQLAQVTRQTHSPIYLELLHGLSHKYFIETRGVLGDSDSSFKLRVLPFGNGTAELKSTALERRYLAGLEKLQMLRDVVASAPEQNLEALGMAEIYIADWQLAFNSSRHIENQYRTATDLLSAAGIPEAQLARFFAHPVAIPRPALTLDFATALAELESTSRAVPASIESTASTWQLAIRESSEHLPGVVSELQNLQSDYPLADDLGLVSLSLAIDPAVSSKFRTRGFSVRNKVIPATIALTESSNLPERSLQDILARVKAIPFRPALQQGVPVSATVAVNYIFHHGERTVADPLLSLR